MTARTFTHSVTGRSVRVLKDSRLERLVEADKAWTEDKATPAPRRGRKTKSDDDDE